ncbi:MAG: hypothetical protein ABR607_01645 [Pyrinomonadaceae bacterium]
MAILLALTRGTAVAATVVFGFALLKRLIIVFGFLFAIFKFIIIIAFLIVLISIAVGMLRDWSRDKNLKNP